MSDNVLGADLLLGIDLGGTKIEIIALENNPQENYPTRFRKRTPTPKHSNPDQEYAEILQTIADLVNECEHSLNVESLPLGVGIPGAQSVQNNLIKNANTTCLIGKPLQQDLSTKLNRPVIIENDANCFALSEAMDGAGKDHNCVFAVIIGTGVGGGLVVNKTLLNGPNRISGEWGHNPLPWPEDNEEPKQDCYCGKQGCIETYLSGPGSSKQNLLEFSEEVSSKELTKHDAAYNAYVRRLAKSLASVINVMDPNVIVLGGGLSNIKSLYEDVPKVWQEFVFGGEVFTQLKPNEHGDSSGVRGAAWLTKTVK